MPIDVVADLERVATQPVVTAFLAESAGYHLVPNPESEEHETLLHAHIVKTGEYASNLFRDWAEFIGNDGVIDSEEAKILLVHSDDLVRTLLKMKKDLILRTQSQEAKDAYKKRTGRDPDRDPESD